MTAAREARSGHQGMIREQRSPFAPEPLTWRGQVREAITTREVDRAVGLFAIGLVSLPMRITESGRRRVNHFTEKSQTPERIGKTVIIASAIAVAWLGFQTVANGIEFQHWDPGFVPVVH